MVCSVVFNKGKYRDFSFVLFDASIEMATNLSKFTKTIILTNPISSEKRITLKNVSKSITDALYFEKIKAPYVFIGFDDSAYLPLTLTNKSEIKKIFMFNPTLDEDSVFYKKIINHLDFNNLNVKINWTLTPLFEIEEGFTRLTELESQILNYDSDDKLSDYILSYFQDIIKPIKNVSGYYHYDHRDTFETFVIKSIKNLSMGQITIQKSSLKNVNPDFDNIFTVPDYEIDFSYIQKSDSFYKFNITKIQKIFKINYGCELETCFKYNCGHKILKTGEFTDDVANFLAVNICPKLTQSFVKKFRYANINYRNELTLFDMKLGLKIDEIPSWNYYNYKFLLFTPDVSIECSDDNYLGVEIISPILDNIHDIKLIYDNLVSKDCNESNSSTGFHVNVSALDQDGEIIPLSKGLMTQLIKNWMIYEEKNYLKLRKIDESIYASRLAYIEKYSSIDSIKSIIKRKNDTNITSKDLYNLSDYLILDKVFNDKFLSLTHWKKNNVVEFRIFPSEITTLPLMTYVKDAIKIFSNSIKDYSNNYQEISEKMQSVYKLYKFEFDKYIESFTGTFNNLYDILRRFMNIGRIIIFYIKKKFFGTNQIILEYELSKSSQFLIIEYPDGWYQYNVNYDEILKISNPKKLTDKEIKMFINLNYKLYFD